MLDVLLIWNCILIENLLFPFNMVTMYRCEILQKIRVYMWELLESEIFWKCWEWYTIMWTLGCGNVQVLGCYICFIKREKKRKEKRKVKMTTRVGRSSIGRFWSSITVCSHIYLWAWCTLVSWTWSFFLYEGEYGGLNQWHVMGGYLPI